MSWSVAVVSRPKRSLKSLAWHRCPLLEWMMPATFHTGYSYLTDLCRRLGWFLPGGGSLFKLHLSFGFHGLNLHKSPIFGSLRKAHSTYRSSGCPIKTWPIYWSCSDRYFPGRNWDHWWMRWICAILGSQINLVSLAQWLREARLWKGCQRNSNPRRWNSHVGPLSPVKPKLNRYWIGYS